ncbi:putative ATP-dependent endonuclease of OLD family [Xanthomonas arboricola]|nr:putative ATP-dependent endonuclease of OLD family [Xanthomonas sp. 3793]
MSIHNFRRLENVKIDIEDNETIFVGPNNSGKTSATAIFRCFLGDREFKVHDFSIARIAEFDSFIESEGATLLPSISLDLWFDIDPTKIVFGQIYTLLPKLFDYTKVGVRVSYVAEDAKKLYSSYSAAYPALEDGSRAKSLSQYLALDKNLTRNYLIKYFSLERDGASSGKIEKVLEKKLDQDEGRQLLKKLVRVEFVDAQRNINDDESNRSNKLSAAFASFYRKNLEQADHAAEAHKVIDDNNNKLTAHYESQFSPLMKLIKSLGVPSINDRDLKIISSLSPETALRGNTELLYVDVARNHELPELYNGLGFKNLIFMAIQARHFHSQWVMTKENRPLSLLIFIEEPEVHLHAQVQQTFINNIWAVINQSAKEAGQPSFVPQLIVTTHSSHILEAIDFEKVRYFQRCYHQSDQINAGVRNASVVRSLRAFEPEIEMSGDKKISAEESLQFLKRYLRLTHCDLFFADAAILIEGAVEKLLIPSMIGKVAERLGSTYLSLLEVGGAYAHRFEGLLEFLQIPYLIITDIDSVVGTGHPTACRADSNGARTSNATLKKLFTINTIAELMKLTIEEKTAGKDRFIAFQTSITVVDGDLSQEMLPRTLEEAIAYENFDLVRSGAMSLGDTVPKNLAEAYQKIYEMIKSDNFKKTDFAMDVLASTSKWISPTYIAEGLKWLENRLCSKEFSKAPGGASNG